MDSATIFVVVRYQFLMKILFLGAVKLMGHSSSCKGSGHENLDFSYLKNTSSVFKKD